MDKVKAAVIGTGYLGRQHVRVLSQLENVELVGVADKNPETARAVATEFSTRAYDNHRALTGKVSAVSLATPTREHASIGIDLLSRGVDVLVEKPIASSLAEADALIALIAPEIYDTYRKIATLRKGVALARASENCQGCHVRIRPSVLGQVMVGKQIVHCDSCARFLYWEPEASG